LFAWLLKLLLFESVSIGYSVISRLSYSLFFCSNISVKAAVNSICLRTCFNFVSLVSQSGCKSRKLISNWQMFFEVFFKRKFLFFSLLKPTNLSMNFPCFAGANVTSVFKSHKLFAIFFWK